MNLNQLSIYKDFVNECLQAITPGQELGASLRMVAGTVIMLITWTADISSMVGSELQQQVRKI